MSTVREIPPERIQGVSLTLLAGFLGAGKTTVLNHLIRSNPGERIGVLVNDFGDIDIDAELVANADGETITLANGCICCTIRDDLVLTLFRLLHRDDPPERVLIECSGVSDPAEVVRAFGDAEIHDVVRLDSIVAVVDAEQFAEVEFAEQPMVLHQLVSADLVVLNKIDLVPEAERDAVEAKIRGTVPDARLVRAQRGQIPFEIVMGTEYEHGPGRARDPAHDHGHEFSRWSWTGDKALSLEQLKGVLEDLPDGVYRAKGIVHVDGFEDRRVIVHVVGKRVELTQGELWGEDPKVSRMVGIGRAGSFEAEALSQAFTGCGVEPGQGVGRRLMSWVRRLGSGPRDKA